MACRRWIWWAASWAAKAARRRWLARTQRSRKNGPFQYLGLLVILLGILKVFRQMRSGTYDEAELEAQLEGEAPRPDLGFDLHSRIGRPRRIRVLLGHGDGTFAAKVDFLAGFEPIAVAVACMLLLIGVFGLVAVFL